MTTHARHSAPFSCLAKVFWGAQGRGQPRALPDGSMDSTMGQLAGVGMGAASAILFAHLLKGATPVRSPPAPCIRPLCHPATMRP